MSYEKPPLKKKKKIKKPSRQSSLGRSKKLVGLPLSTAGTEDKNLQKEIIDFCEFLRFSKFLSSL